MYIIWGSLCLRNILLYYNFLNLILYIYDSLLLYNTWVKIFNFYQLILNVKKLVVASGNHPWLITLNTKENGGHHWLITPVIRLVLLCVIFKWFCLQYLDRKKKGGGWGCHHKVKEKSEVKTFFKSYSLLVYLKGCNFII